MISYEIAASPYNIHPEPVTDSVKEILIVSPTDAVVDPFVVPTDCEVLIVKNVVPFFFKVPNVLAQILHLS